MRSFDWHSMGSYVHAALVGLVSSCCILTVAVAVSERCDLHIQGTESVQEGLLILVVGHGKRFPGMAVAGPRAG